MSEDIAIEVAYATPEKQLLLELSVRSGSNVEQAIQASGILSQRPEIDLKINKVVVWNKVCKLSQVLQANDRIEIYRPLIADPKEVRKRRAQKAIDEGRADKVTGGRPNPVKKAAS